MTNSFQSTAFTSSASPVDTFVAPPSVQPKTGLQELASALKSINPNLQKFVATRMEKAVENERADMTMEIAKKGFKQIIKEHCDGKFGTLLISNRYKGEGKELIQQKLDEYNLPMFYWTSTQDFNFKKALDLIHVSIRIQLCIKTLAVFNIGNQTGVNDTIAKYTPTYTVPRGKLGSNYIKSEIYI